MTLYKSGFDYFSREKPGLWDLDAAFTLYRNEHPTVCNSELVQLIQTDLITLMNTKPKLSKFAKDMLTTLKAISNLMNDKPVTASSSSSKVADTWNSNGCITINQQTSQKRKADDNIASRDGIQIKKGSKSYSIIPQMKPSISTHKSHVSDADSVKLSPLYAIKMHDRHTMNTPQQLIDQYEQNKDDQAANASLLKRPAGFQFLKDLLSLPLNEWRSWLWTDSDNDVSQDDKDLIELIRLVMTDFTANCKKPDYPTRTNERTPFVESIVPLFKYLSSVLGNVAFVWCEKGLAIPQAGKLLDGIGMTTMDEIERVLIESSGLDDSTHTNEDTIKLLEYTALCLHHEKARYPQAAYATFLNRRLIGIQFVGFKLSLLSTLIMDNRWACLLERTAIIPHRWEERFYWIQAFELLDLLKEQDQLTTRLIHEHNGCIDVPKKETMRAHYRLPTMPSDTSQQKWASLPQSGTAQSRTEFSI